MCGFIPRVKRDMLIQWKSVSYSAIIRETSCRRLKLENDSDKLVNMQRIRELVIYYITPFFQGS